MDKNEEKYKKEFNKKMRSFEYKLYDSYDYEPVKKEEKYIEFEYKGDMRKLKGSSIWVEYKTAGDFYIYFDSPNLERMFKTMVIDDIYEILDCAMYSKKSLGKCIDDLINEKGNGLVWK